MPHQPPDEAKPTRGNGAQLAVTSAMAKVLAMPEQGIISGFKGKVTFALNNGIPCARKWPRSPGSKRTPAVIAGWAPFSYIADKWLLLPPEIREAYETMASGSGLSGRDMFTRSYISGLFEAPE